MTKLTLCYPIVRAGHIFQSLMGNIREGIAGKEHVQDKE